MKEQDFADKFSLDIDTILNSAGRLEHSGELPLDYANLVEIARELSEADYAGESRIRESLRSQLLAKVAAREEQKRAKLGTMETIMSIFKRRRRPITALTTLAVATLGVHLLFPGAIPAAAQSIENFVEKVMLRRTVVTHVAPSQVKQNIPGLPEDVSKLPNAENFVIKKNIEIKPGGTGSEDLKDVLENAKVVYCNTIEEARQAAKKFTLRVPDYLPKDYKLKQAIIVPIGVEVLIYSGPKGEIQLSGSAATLENQETKDEVMTEQRIQKVLVNGQPACWIENIGLSWDTNDMNYTLAGPGMDIKELTMIAESIN